MTISSLSMMAMSCSILTLILRLVGVRVVPFDKLKTELVSSCLSLLISGNSLPDWGALALTTSLLSCLCSAVISTLGLSNREYPFSVKEVTLSCQPVGDLFLCRWGYSWTKQLLTTNIWAQRRSCGVWGEGNVLEKHLSCLLEGFASPERGVG